jgi:hypothetical protein
MHHFRPLVKQRLEGHNLRSGRATQQSWQHPPSPKSVLTLLLRLVWVW